MTAARASSTVSPEGSLAALSASASVAPAARAAWATASAKPLKLSSLATKSVSELTSTSTALPPSWALTMRPSAATRLAFLSALARPDLRSASAAASMSPPASVSAFLHSIMPAPVRSRSSLTWDAVISMGYLDWDGGGGAAGSRCPGPGRPGTGATGAALPQYAAAPAGAAGWRAYSPAGACSLAFGARRAGLPSVSEKSSSRTAAAFGAAALPSSTASAAARAYSCTARMASSLPGMA